MSLLAIDIGNTNIVAGLFQNKTLQQHSRFASHKEFQQKDWQQMAQNQMQALCKNEPQAWILASVVPDLTAYCIATLKQLYPKAKGLVVDHQKNFGFKIALKQPKQVGIDRLVNSSYAYELAQGDVISIDLGTATTFDVVTQEQGFIGGVIMPGFKTAFESLAKRADQIKEIPELKKPKAVVGDNTLACLQSGLYHGYASIIDGMVQKISEEQKRDFKVYITGGLAPLFLNETKCGARYEEHLTLKGLQIVWERGS
ncbi:MAG: type III pantothenate kinase [Deltaproteobacteria bacterium]|nr:type III pantothenate kinase [Deltaproteobacteria bacterium]